MWGCSSLLTPELRLWKRLAPLFSAGKKVYCLLSGSWWMIHTPHWSPSYTGHKFVLLMDKICPGFGSGWEIHGLNKSPRELVQDVVALQCICWEPGRAGRSLCFMAWAEVGLSPGPKNLKFKRGSALLPQRCDKYAL